MSKVVIITGLFWNVLEAHFQNHNLKEKEQYMIMDVCFLMRANYI